MTLAVYTTKLMLDVRTPTLCAVTCSGTLGGIVVALTSTT
jgi:hypothetical protein